MSKTTTFHMRCVNAHLFYPVPAADSALSFSIPSPTNQLPSNLVENYYSDGAQAYAFVFRVDVSAPCPFCGETTLGVWALPDRDDLAAAAAALAPAVDTAYAAYIAAMNDTTHAAFVAADAIHAAAVALGRPPPPPHGAFSVKNLSPKWIDIVIAPSP